LADQAFHGASRFREVSATDVGAPPLFGNARSGQRREAVGKAAEVDGNADAFLGRLEDDEGSRFAGFQRFEKLRFEMTSAKQPS